MAHPATLSVNNYGGLLSGLRSTFMSGRTREVAWRLAQLKRLRALVVEREADWIAALRADFGKPAFETWVTEIGFLRADIDHALRNLKRWVRPEKVSTPMVVKPASGQVQRQPYGVALIISPWNYPMHLALAPLVGAIAAGNCAVLKPSELSPATSGTLAKLIHEYLDTDCVRVVEGGVPETQTLLDEAFDVIFFTGGTSVGRIVMTAAAKHLTPVILELGGKSPCIVDREVDLEVAARRIAWGKFMNAGQTCVAPDYVLAHADIETKLVDALVKAVRQFYGADPKASPDYARIINPRHLKRLASMLGSGQVVLGGQLDEKERYLAPTILRHVPADAPVMSEEIFGPILPIISVPNIDAALTFVNARPKPLALYVFSSDRSTQERVLAATSSGGACINDIAAHLGAPDLPFGGVGASGIGGYHGRSSFECFSHHRSVLNKSTFLDPAIRYPPYSASKLKWIKRIM